MFFPNPDGMSLQDWADAATYSIINYPNSWQMQNGEWQSWGMIFFLDPYLSRYDPPNPYDFTDWMDWAKRLADSMSAAPGSPSGGIGPGGTPPGPPPTPPPVTFIIAQTGAVLTTQSGNNLITQ